MENLLDFVEFGESSCYSDQGHRNCRSRTDVAFRDQGMAVNCSESHSVAALLDSFKTDYFAIIKTLEHFDIGVDFHYGY